MTTGFSTTAELNAFFNNIFDDAVFVARERNIMSGLVTVKSDRIGDETRTNLIYNRVTAQSVGEGVDFVNPTQFTKSSISTVTVGEVMAQVVLTDRRIETDPQQAQIDASWELGQAMADKVEQDLLGTFSSLTGGTIGAGTQVMTWGHLFAGRTRLRNAKTPGPFVAVLHEYHWHNLAKTLAPGAPLVQSPAGMVDDIARQWYMGTVAGIDIFTTANIQITSTPSAYSGIYHRAAIIFDSRRAPSLEPERDASLRAWELNISAKYGYGTWRPTFGCALYFDATAPTS